MKIKFWGVRGSIPCPGPQTMKYGGNTVCLELRFKASDRLIIIDSGSGIRELGNYMMAHDLQKGPIRAEIYLTHTHFTLWDFFFSPQFIFRGQRLKFMRPFTMKMNHWNTLWVANWPIVTFQYAMLSWLPK